MLKIPFDAIIRQEFCSSQVRATQFFCDISISELVSVNRNVPITAGLNDSDSGVTILLLFMVTEAGKIFINLSIWEDYQGNIHFSLNFDQKDIQNGKIAWEYIEKWQKNGEAFCDSIS